MIQIPAFFDRIPEINIKNSHQKVVDLIHESDLTKELTAHLSSDFVQTTNQFIGGAAQLIENNYEGTPTVLEKLKAIDKEYDIPFKNLKNTITEFTQEISARSETTGSKPPSAMKDNFKIEIEEPSKRKKKGGKGSKGRAPEDAEDEEVISYAKQRGGKNMRISNMEEEGEESNAQGGGARIDEEVRRYHRGYISEEEDPEANIFDEEFGRPIKDFGKVSPMPTTRAKGAGRGRKKKDQGEDDDDEDFVVEEKKPTKRKAPASHTADIEPSQGKRQRGKAKEGKTSATSKKFL